MYIIYTHTVKNCRDSMSYGVILAQGINMVGSNPGSNQNASSSVIVKLLFLVKQKINPEPLGLSHIKIFPRVSSSFCEFHRQSSAGEEGDREISFLTF